MLFCLGVAFSPSGTLPDSETFPGRPLDSSPAATQALVDAVGQLPSQDYLVVRRGISRIGNLAKASNSSEAVEFLEVILENSHHRWDLRTRAYAPLALAKIAAAQGYPNGQEAIDSLIYYLHQSPSDVIRAACASALAVSRYPSAVDELESALENDSSPLVQYQTCGALIRLSNGEFSDDDCRSQAGSGIVQQKGLHALNNHSLTTTENISFQEEALRQWWSSHVLLPWPGQGVKP